MYIIKLDNKGSGIKKRRFKITPQHTISYKAIRNRKHFHQKRCNSRITLVYYNSYFKQDKSKRVFKRLENK